MITIKNTIILKIFHTLEHGEKIFVTFKKYFTVLPQSKPQNFNVKIIFMLDTIIIKKNPEVCSYTVPIKR
jgi:hypothetical protein